MKDVAAQIRIRWRPAGTDGWQYQTFPAGSAFKIDEIQEGELYDIDAQSIGRYGLISAWAVASIAVPTATPISDRSLELDIDGGAVVIDGRYRAFRLTLTEDVTVEFINMPPAWDGSIEIEQWGAGGHAVAWPARVVPTSGIPHAMTPSPGAVDIVDLSTTNGGGTYYQTVFAAGVSFAGVISPSPATGTSTTDGTSPSSPSVQVLMTVANETPPATYSWVRDDAGGADFLIDDPAREDPTFSIAAGTTTFNATQRWRCTATDGTGRVAQATANITLARAMSGAGALAVSLAPTTITGTATAPASPQASTILTASGGTAPYTVTWQRIDANGGGDFGHTPGAFGQTFTSGGAVFSRQQLWRATVNDSAGGVGFDQVTVNLSRSF